MKKVMLGFFVLCLCGIAFAKKSKYDTCVSMAKKRKKACIERVNSMADMTQCSNTYIHDIEWCDANAES
jgi:hypothetical protein